jgi:hypothetical protein
MSRLTLPDDPEIVSRLLESIEALEARLPHEKHPDEPSERNWACCSRRPSGSACRRKKAVRCVRRWTLLPPDAASNAFVFQSPLPFTPEGLLKLGPAIPHKRRAVGLNRIPTAGSRSGGTCEPPFNTPLVVVAGTRCGGRPALRPGPDALLGRRAVFLDGADASTLLSIVSTSVKDETSFADPFSFSSAFLGLLRSMLEQGHGGTILAVQPGSTSWLDCLSSVRYQPVAPTVPCTRPFRGVRQRASFRSSWAKPRRRIAWSAFSTRRSTRWAC